TKIRDSQASLFSDFRIVVISDLRIVYCIEQLKTNETYRKYSLKAIAFELGYNNAESFSKDFYRKTGIYPSLFIREFENQNSI
ncbi:MAG: hypothetical protein RQ864_13160, partial [Lutibacter sp.]|nr:hypothetical protein [Lutibacter sp.]